jgi:hypothetical protein
MIISGSILLRMRNVSDKMQRKSKQTLFQKRFPENLTVYEIKWENTVEPKRLQMTIRRLFNTC